MHETAATLDKIDRHILSILSHQGRISMIDLGQIVGLSKTPVAARVKRLEAEGFIMGYRAELSPTHLSLDHITFVEVKLTDTREKALQAFNKAVRTILEIEECHMIAGGFDYLLKVRTRGISAYRYMLGEKISQLPFVASTSTYVSMESIRDPGVQQDIVL